MKIIQMENVGKAFNKSVLFKNVNISFDRGRIYGVVGSNGSGKSVLFKIICGFIQPDTGRVNIHSDFKQPKENFPKSCGIIIDRPAYIANKTGFENLKRLAMIQNKISDEDIKETMNKVGLDWGLKQKVKHYSLGMKQKLSIAQAIMENQQLLILDEPFNGLDKKSVAAMRQLFTDLNKKEGKTIIFTSHNQEDILKLSDIIYEIDNQQISICHELT
ncbi:ATP-binding cassette domain-containing protein [Sporosarcina sp. HYO08]|uniref:ABC transporter ATP-binding protein n=1 Tax=Sporosarcina sp. HYO08 TaxID=1759557 RepID=UPI0012E3457F|nr:ABC transporter ATP-binding protein [Sporosarcina sp. HYO08]